VIGFKTNIAIQIVLLICCGTLYEYKNPALTANLMEFSLVDCQVNSWCWQSKPGFMLLKALFSSFSLIEKVLAKMNIPMLV